ncbi:MAG: hypothetical protein SWO11_21380 [Thermodesulfobacteriota bacterium]|nr:hypothetical protein [Thermodesulfobacteriota bacterium]
MEVITVTAAGTAIINDSPFAGLAFYVRAGQTTGRLDYQIRADEAAEFNRTLLADTLTLNTVEFLSGLHKNLFAVMGLIEYMDATGSQDGIELVEDTLSRINRIMKVIGYYVSAGSNSVASVYGQTTATNLLTIANLQYARTFPSRFISISYVNTANKYLNAINRNAWNGSYYEFSPDLHETVGTKYFYPNVTTMISLTRMYEATGNTELLEKAIDLFDEMETLKYNWRPGYYTPYSKNRYGAQTDDFTSLSPTGYAILALSSLYYITHDQKYLNGIYEQLTFIRDYLHDPAAGLIRHHWIDGAIAPPSAFVCIGCNLQILWTMWRLENGFN